MLDETRTADPAATDRTPVERNPLHGPGSGSPGSSWPASSSRRSISAPRSPASAPSSRRPATGLHMSGSVAGVLTSVPPLCFAVFGITAPRLARRFGSGAVVFAGMAAIAAGLLIRPFAGGTPGFLAASALALMGIAVSNVLMPVIVKRYFPDRVGSMTGLYSMALALGTAVAAAATVPMTDALGGSWRTGLAVWALLAVLAVLPWAGLIRDRSAAARHERADASARTRRDVPPPRITRSPTAWALACFFGLQATGAYITMGWMPQIFRDAGVPAGDRGSPARRDHGDGCAAGLRHPAARLPDEEPGPDRRRPRPVRADRLCGPVLRPRRRSLGLGAAAGHLELRLPARPHHDRHAVAYRRRSRQALGLRPVDRLSDLHPRAAAGRRPLPAQRRLGAADRADGRADRAADRGGCAGRPGPDDRGRGTVCGD